ncbi:MULTISPECIES: MobV family relaxase [Nostocales]|uniref:MobV family relaxase n=1 Tax=Nostocales TaxID=1161 RepID=UPI0016879E99|nr:MULTISPECIES: MobV family relaxase [Nostocales]MBD2303282.1 plasmid recombination protein [Nostoc sp. FACHB-190]MBD2491261.1 plasmid recombination protein [Aulosira sp. FACHB-615]
MSYAIARLKKLKRSNLTGSAAHTARERPTPNADPTQQNLRFIGSLNPEERLENLVLAKIGEYEQKRKIRTDGVYCVELLLSASPSYFRPDNPSQAGDYDPQRLDAWLEATHQWLADEYGDRIVRAELHLDEATPHIHAYFVPLDDEGQLRCSHFFDGRQKIQQFQESYYQTMRLIGLERGLKGSRAQHLDIKEFYRIVESGRDLEAEDLNPEQLKAKAADRDRATHSKEEMEATAKALAKENELLRKQIAELEQQTQQLRDLLLEDVAWELGLHHDQGRWRGHGNIISINGSKFYDFSLEQQKGGGGAIDLVMHVNSCNFREAIAWLSDRFGEAGAERAAIAHAKNATSEIIQSEPRPQFRLPVEDKAKWQLVSNYLTQNRGIGENLVQSLHERGLIYADDQQNAVFVMRNLGDLPHAKGAFLRGTRGENNSFKGYEKGTKRREGWFYFHLGGQPTDPPEKLVLCKSPINAMSIAMLEYQVRGDVPPTRTLYMAVDSPNSLPVEQLQHIPNVQVAFDPDESGNVAARAVKELLPQATRLKCKAGDWNQELVQLSQKLNPQKNEAMEL